MNFNHLPSIVLLFILQLCAVQSACPNLCSGHGECSRPDLTCNCFFGWEGGDCSLRKCKLGFAWSDEAKATDHANPNLHFRNEQSPPSQPKKQLHEM